MVWKTMRLLRQFCKSVKNSLRAYILLCHKLPCWKKRVCWSQYLHLNHISLINNTHPLLKKGVQLKSACETIRHYGIWNSNSIFNRLFCLINCLIGLVTGDFLKIHILSLIYKHILDMVLFDRLGFVNMLPYLLGP